MANVIVAFHTFLSNADRGSHVRVRCDNQATVSILTTGRAQNEVLQDCARAAWMVQAILGVNISYDHIQGRDNDVADALSRAHLSQKHVIEAQNCIAHYTLQPVEPCLFYLCNSEIHLLSRSGAVISPQTHPGHDRQQQGSSTHIHRLYGKVPSRPPQPNFRDDLRTPGVCGGVHLGARDHMQQDVTRPYISPAGRTADFSNRTPKGQDGPRSDRQRRNLHSGRFQGLLKILVKILR